jgi:hypothetical protein
MADKFKFFPVTMSGATSIVSRKNLVSPLNSNVAGPNTKPNALACSILIYPAWVL